MVVRFSGAKATRGMDWNLCSYSPVSSTLLEGELVTDEMLMLRFKDVTWLGFWKRDFLKSAQSWQ